MAIDPNNLAGTAHLTFNDDFNALSLWSPSNPGGTWATTFWYQDPNGNGATLEGNGEQEWYINANYGPTSSVHPWTVGNGVLTLTAAPASASISPLINGYGYTSGEVNTYHSFSQTYGYFEMKAQLPSGQGFWPAFWLLPESGAWPPELDVMEVLGNNTSILYNTVHTEQTGTHTTTGDGGVTVADMSSGYHTYGVDWEPDTITFYFDGHELYQTATPADMNQPMYMIANLADGGYWPGGANGQTGHMNIDYIRAYASGAAAGVSSAAPAAPTTTTTSPAPSSPASTTTSSPTGQTFTSDNNGDHWTGTAGNDTFNLGRGADVVTGNGGADTFVYHEYPWAAAGHITDFGSDDVLDLSPMFARYGYTGSNPLADGHLKFVSDGNGGTQVWFNGDGLPVGNLGSWLVTDLDHVSASSLTISSGRITTSGSTASSTGSSSGTAGQTFTSDNNGDHWTGTAGNDTFNLGRGADVVTGNGGADTFVYHEYPWAAAGHITDFGSDDVLDLSPMFARYGYTGSNPLADGHLKFVSDGNGGTQVWFDGDGLPVGNLGSWLVTDLDHVAPSSLGIASGRITETGSSSAAVTGQTFTSDNAGDHFTGTAGNDVFNVGRGGDWLTGNGGNDSFVFHEYPWANTHIADFGPGDTLDLSAMLTRYGYTGSNPVGDGRIQIASDGSDGAQVWFHGNGLPVGNLGDWQVADLQHVNPAGLHVNGAFITG